MGLEHAFGVAALVGGLLFAVLTAVLLPLALFVVLLRLVAGPRGKQRGEQTAAEARLMQEVHMGLTKMEERIEALETLLIDERRKEALK